MEFTKVTHAHLNIVTTNHYRPLDGPWPLLGRRGVRLAAMDENGTLERLQEIVRAVKAGENLCSRHVWVRKMEFLIVVL